MAGISMSALRRALAERMASGGRLASGLGQYAAITGGLGGVIGGGMAALSGGPDADHMQDALDGARDGAMVGPITIPAMGSAALGILPLAGTGALVQTLASLDQPSRRRVGREHLAEADAFGQMVRDQQEEEYERMMRARFGGEEDEEPTSLRDVLRNLIEADMAAGRGQSRMQDRQSNDAMDAVRFHGRGMMDEG